MGAQQAPVYWLSKQEGAVMKVTTASVASALLIPFLWIVLIPVLFVEKVLIVCRLWKVKRKRKTKIWCITKATSFVFSETIADVKEIYTILFEMLRVQ